jgi:hypothetical protein
MHDRSAKEKKRKRKRESDQTVGLCELKAKPLLPQYLIFYGQVLDSSKILPISNPYQEHATL